MTWDGTVEDTWHNLTPNSPYTTNATVQVRIDSSGNIHLTGDVNRNAATSGATLCTLDEPYRPTALVYRLILTGPLGTSTGYLSVATNGDVALVERTGTVTRYYLNSTAPYSAL